MFQIGDTIVYPQHGAGRVVDKVEREFQGENCLYYLIEIMHNQMTVMVPVDRVEQTGLRAVISPEMLDEVVGVLRDDATKMPVNWSRRIRHNRDKIKTGDILEIAGVLRNLALRDHERGLSTGEKQMYGKLRRIIASEVMCAKKIDEDDALSFIDDILDDVCSAQPCTEEQ